MIKKRITYTDYDGVERTEDFYFNISKSELAEMEMTTAGSFTGALQKMIDAKDVTDLAKMVKFFILKAYGEKTPDGKRFTKSEELSTAFSQTPAYDQLFMEIFTNTDVALEFINGLMPAELVKQVADEKKQADNPALALSD